MKLRSLRQRFWPAALRTLGLSTAVVAATSCGTLDTTRVVGPNATLGDDIYGVLCDRVGASVLAEDLSGASYDAVCHYDAKGHYGDKVDTAQLPPASTAAEKTARKLAVAKLERMAQRRGDLVHAINATFPDTSIPDVTSKDQTKQIRLHDALFTFGQTVSQLYESNPVDPKGAPLLPSHTRSMARLFDAIGAPGTCAGATKKCTWDSDCGAAGICQSPVRGALSHMWGRQGYRPFQVGLGAVRPALGYPDLRKLTTSTLSVLGPGGSASPELQQVLDVMQQELVTAGATVSPLPPLSVTAAIAQPNRPRQNIEFASALFLTQNAAFASGTAALPNYIALRDRRGVVIPAGNVPGDKTTITAPFSDLDGDGYADIDSFGRFVDVGGTPLALDPPFAIPGQTTGSADGFGRPDSSSGKYAYLDTTRTMVSGVTRHLVPLLDPTKLAPTADPAPWKQEHETLMYALAGAYLLYGDREQATYDYGTEGAKGKKVTYTRFNPDDSPIPDLVHAAGQVLADKDSDTLVLSLLDLLQNHEQVVARLLGAALNIREIARKHDAAAAGGTEKLASLAYEVPIWDEMGKIVAQIVQHPHLLEKLLAALADDTTVTSFGGAKHMGDALSKFASFRDEMSYNKFGTGYDGTGNGINGPAANVTVSPNGGATDDPKTPVDRTKPQTGKNISDLQKSLQLIHDANGGPACNKEGALVEARIFGTSFGWPITGFPFFAAPYHECEFFQIDNLANFYVNSMLPAAHPKRSQLAVKGFINDLLTYAKSLPIPLISPDDLFQQSSDITGLTLHPEPFALNRLVFYGTDSGLYGAMPDHDGQNAGGITDNFVSNLIEPISAAWCPPDASNAVPTCSDAKSTVRLRDPNSIFLWERFGFTNYLGPLVRAFANVACDANEANCDLNNFQGEKIFIDLVEVLNKHWPAADHGPECSKSSGSIPCSEAGVNRYEPILGEAFAGDIIPALHEFAKVAVQISKIPVARGPAKGQIATGAQLLEKITKILFDPAYASSVGMVDRKGKASTTWVDGTAQPQVTVFSLFADALHKIDTRFAGACDCAKKTGQDQAECMKSFNACRADADDRQGQWKRARSQLVDEFLAVDGTGTSAAFHNPTVAPMLIATLQLAREQTNANCPDRENGTPCTWARTDLGKKLADVMGRPMFATLMDMQEKLRQDDGARRELETFLQYVLSSMTDNGQSLQGAMASIADLLQVLADDGDLAPLLDAASVGAAPDADPAGPGTGTLTIKVLKALTDDKYDQYHVMDHVLPNLVTPIDGTNLAPIEIFMDVISDVNRIDSAQSAAPMADDDYQAVMSTMTSFMTDKTRGLEQLYTIIQKRPNP
jgi:hypothetical protein